MILFEVFLNWLEIKWNWFSNLLEVLVIPALIKVVEIIG